MEPTTDNITTVMENNDIKGLVDIYDYVKRQLESRNVRFYKAFPGLRDLVQYCVIYDRPELLEYCLRQTIVEPNFCHSGLAIDQLAEGLERRECLNLLQSRKDTCQSNVKDKTSDCALFVAILNLHKKSEKNWDIVVSCLKRLVEVGHDITQHDSSERSPLHHAISLKVCVDVIRAMMTLGSDVNAVNKFGETAFQLFVSKSHYYVNRVEFLQILKILLFYNPSPDMNPHVIGHVLKTDLKIIERESNVDPGVVTDPISIGEDYVTSCEDETTPFRLLLTPLLWECGFGLGGVLKYDSSTCFKTVDSPVTLKKICRQVIRKTCTGRKVHKLVENLPKSIVDYVLIKDVLAW